MGVALHRTLGVFLELGLSLSTFYSPLVYHYYYISTVALLVVHILTEIE
jgi:hypothetical protein